MAVRRTPVHPAAAAEAARKAAKAAAAAKAERAPGKLTAAEAQLLPGKTVLELGNAGKLKHLGVGTALIKPVTPAVATPKGTSRSAAQRGTSATRTRKGRK